MGAKKNKAARSARGAPMQKVSAATKEDPREARKEEAKTVEAKTKEGTSSLKPLVKLEVLSEGL